MKKNNKIISKITIILLILISIFALYNIHNSTAFRLDEVLLRDSSSNSSMFAIMVENDDGEYEQYTDSTSWPTNMSFNEELSGCVDDDGNTVEGILSFSDGLATVNTTKTVYCYLYFDMADITVITTVNGTESNTPTTGAYTVTTTSGSYWSEKNRTLNITSTSSINAKYTLAFASDSSTKTYLRDYIVSLAGTTSGNGYLIDEGDAGYRYEGANPNNYVWFNNEMWRIIGVIPTVTSSETENLVKLIRNTDIGSFEFSKYSGFTWESSILYTLLNSYYWGAIDATGTDYCKGGSGITLPNCDYTVKGISSSSYYGNMVQYVYWNTGSSAVSTPATVYANETATQTVGGYIGIMNASDFGYAYYTTNHSTSMSSYSSSSITALNWLYITGDTWTMTVKDNSSPIRIEYRGYCITSIYYYGFSVRPVVYLNSNVYIIDGTGSESDPYILGID